MKQQPLLDSRKISARTASEHPWRYVSTPAVKCDEPQSIIAMLTQSADSREITANQL
jgi:hypothetical protein